jgi:hypothetical protein
MTLQAFVAEGTDLSRVVVAPESDVNVLAVGSDEFFATLERDRGFRRVTLPAQAGDTIATVGRRYDVPARTMERINRRSRGEVLKVGEPVVVYVPAPSGPSPVPAAGGEHTATTSRRAVAVVSDERSSRRNRPDLDPEPIGPLPPPPIPDLLP